MNPFNDHLIFSNNIYDSAYIKRSILENMLANKQQPISKQRLSKQEIQNIVTTQGGLDLAPKMDQSATRTTVDPLQSMTMPSMQGQMMQPGQPGMQMPQQETEAEEEPTETKKRKSKLAGQ